ncbi:MAG: histone deacetylase family protein [Sulfitobacter sp.]
MKAFFDERQLGHKPAVYYRGGAPMAHPEQPERAILIRDMLLENGFPVEAPSDFGTAPIKAVHDPDYVDFFTDAHARFVKEAPADALGIPTRHPGTRRGRLPKDINGALGWWMTDTSTPLTENTYEAIYWSAQTALSAAAEVMTGARVSYGLSRPPGHHAMKDCANGFCFYNNASIAAHHMLGKWSKVALLDVDVHTGNGSMDVFYDRSDVFFCSLHPDPATYPTFYLGYADETGEGDGIGATRNEVLQLGDGEPEVLAALDKSITAIEEFGAEALVISLGFDMASDDPLAAVNVDAGGFADMARRIAAMDLPTVLVQEGGYLGPSLKTNAQAFLTAFRDAV